MRKTILSPTMVVALAALFVALGGPGYAAGRVQTLFAERAGTADKVDGFHASAKPKPRTLLALNRKGKFPASVLTVKAGPAGPKGDRGPQGDAGPRGDAGPKGDPGAAGLIYAESRNLNLRSAPPPVPETVFPGLTFTLPASGKVLVSGMSEATGTCPAGGATCRFATGLYVDGKPIPYSNLGAAQVPAGETASVCNGASWFYFSGGQELTDPLPAGTHELTLGFSQTAGLPAALTLCDPELSATGPYQ